MNPELLCDYQCETGEGPIWHPGEQRLYWLDIPAGRMFRYDPATEEHELVYEGSQVGGFTIQDDGSLLLFGEQGSVRRWHHGELSTLIEKLPGEETTRFNDVIADPEGRVFCGTMPASDHPARLYRLDVDGSIKLVLDNVGLSNGMGFSPDRSTLYFTDSSNRVIYAFSYDQAGGGISEQRVFARIEGVEQPDGLTVDADGFVWSARWDGSRLVRYTPEGEIERVVEFPVTQVSCLTFGGADYRDIYVTTAGGHERPARGLLAGALFRLRIDGIRGVPEFHSRVRVPDVVELTS